MSNRFEEVLKRVLALTEEGKQSWRETPDDSSFVTEFANGISLLVSRRCEGWDEDEAFYSQCFIKAELLNSSGKIVEEYEAEEAGWLSDLYSKSRSSARKSNEVLSDIWNEIGL